MEHARSLTGVRRCPLWHHYWRTPTDVPYAARLISRKVDQDRRRRTDLSTNIKLLQQSISKPALANLLAGHEP